MRWHGRGRDESSGLVGAFRVTIGGSRLSLVVAVAVGLWIPLIHVHWFQSHEQVTYVVRTMEWAEELRTGHLYPRWAPDLYGGYGEPMFVFFAPAVYAVSGLLSATFLDPIPALKLIALASSVLSGVSVYLLIRGETRDPDAAMVGAIAYLAAPYRLGDLYDRGDLSEFCCLAVLPLVFALYLAAAREAQPFRARLLAASAGLAHGVMIMTHTIIGLWGTALVGLVVGVRVIVLIRRGLWRRTLPLVFALGCAPGIAAAYIVPAMVYRNVTHVAVMITGFLKPQNQWIFLRTLFDLQYDMFGRNFMRIGPIVVVAIVMTVLGAALNFKRARPALAWLSLSLVLVGLTLPGALSFWEPGRIPLAQFIQFPWRLLGPGVLCACLALGMGSAAAARRLGERPKSVIAIAGSAAFVLLLAWPHVSADNYPEGWVPANADAVRGTVESTTASDEFLPLAVSAPPKEPRTELVAAVSHAKTAQVASDGSIHTLSIDARRPNATVTLALYDFPGWSVRTLSGPGNATLEHDEQGLLRVHLPAIGDYEVRVAYGAPPAAKLGVLISALSLLALGSMLLHATPFWPRRWPSFSFGSRAS